MDKRTMLRYLKCFALLIILAIGVLNVLPVQATGKTNIAFGEEVGAIGGEVNVPVTITDNPGVATFRFRVSFNMEGLTFISAEKGNVLTTGTLTYAVDNEKKTVTFLWFSPTNVSGDGEIVNLKFRIKDSAKGEYPLEVTCLAEDFLNETGEQIPYSVQEGKILTGCIMKVEHSYEWIVDKEENCGVPGVKHEECSVCHDKQNVNTTIPATNIHEYSNASDVECNQCGYERTLTEIAISSKPNKTTYLEAKDILDVTGGKLTLYYNDGSEGKIDIASSMVSGFDNTKVGSQTLTVSYGGLKVTYDIEVVAKSLTRIEVTNKPTKLTFFEDEEFDSTGMVITAYYNNDTSEIVTDYTYSGYDAIPGNKMIAVSYLGKTATFEVTVKFIDYTVVFLNWDGSVISSQIYHKGDVVTMPSDPIKSADMIYTYTFIGWDKTVENCMGDATYTATYLAHSIDYTVEFKNDDGTVLSSKTYHYGDAVIIPGTPAKASDNTYTYEFAGWDSSVTECNGNKVYTATYTATYIEYTVIFKNWDGTVLSTSPYHYGDTVTIPTTPNRPDDDTYTYTFIGWDQEVVACNGNAVYTAVYSSEVRVPSTITSSTYVVGGTTISKISAGTTVSTLVSQLNESQYVKVYNGNQEVDGSNAIGTGMAVKIMDGDVEKASYTVIVTGDTNGDGDISIVDMIAIKAQLLQKSDLAGEYAIAADTNGDGDISILDFMQVKAKILGKGEITPQSAPVEEISAISSVASTSGTVVIPNGYQPLDALVPENKSLVFA